jgi:hypothetical protein
MAARKQQNQSGEASKAETKAQILKKLLNANQARREGRLSDKDFNAINVQLRASPIVRRQNITLIDTDPFDSIITSDSDPNDMIHMYDVDLTDRIFGSSASPAP